jgi:hypothetical protein
MTRVLLEDDDVRNDSLVDDLGVDDLGDDDLGDDDLTALALAADPDTEVAPDAIPLAEFLGLPAERGLLLPTWYMPAPAAHAPARRWWRTSVAVLIIVSFVVITALGLCITYGHLEGV